MKISDEAVEAAAKSVIAALRAMELGWVDTDMPDGVTIDVRDFNLTAAISAALEAAAPHLMAAAWEEGERTGRSRAMRMMSDEPSLNLVAVNPYRPAGSGE